MPLTVQIHTPGSRRTASRAASGSTTGRRSAAGMYRAVCPWSEGSKVATRPPSRRVTARWPPLPLEAASGLPAGSGDAYGVGKRLDANRFVVPKFRADAVAFKLESSRAADVDRTVSSVHFRSTQRSRIKVGRQRGTVGAAGFAFLAPFSGWRLRIAAGSSRRFGLDPRW